MNALLLALALTASANGPRTRVVAPRSNTTGVTVVPTLPIVALNAATFGNTVTPTVRADAPVSIPLLTPLAPLAAADAPVHGPSPAPAPAPAPGSEPAPEPARVADPAADAAADAASNAAVRPTVAPAPADSPSFVRRTAAFLARIVNPFGDARRREEPPPANEAQRLDREFMKLDLWGRVAPAAAAEIRALRARRLDKAALKAHVQAEVEAAFERVKAARGTTNVGFHYNLHGGRREDYVGGGLRAGIPDDGSRDVIHWQARPDQVYFFQTQHAGAYAALDARNPALEPWPSRMGSVLNVFALDAPVIEAAKADGRIRNHGAISMDFHGMRGIPYSTYLAPPLFVFDGSAKKALGLGRLSREEETLATARYLEAALLAGGDYVPR
ncbi:MAG: hypothetical protein SF051_00815 [Elusimicrobiota bacterium]|nr:hypothetical protein [Elusimicrobiota bacterium]